MYRQTRTFPSKEKFGLTSQLRRAAVSVASNRVEGSSRDSLADYIRFLDMAYGSVCEVECQVSLTHRLSYFNESNANQLTELANETARVINGLLRSLRQKLHESRSPSSSPSSLRPEV